MTCSRGADCATGFCFDGTCCQTDCSGTCRSCANSTGTCTLAAKTEDPRIDCAPDAQHPCRSVGTCNGSGACTPAPKGAVCDQTPTCDTTNASVIPRSTCDGAGTCAPEKLVSCKGFACAAGACETSCSDDSPCALGAFCSASICVGTPNLAGNGDLESGTLAGWAAANGGSPLHLSAAADAGYAHGGAYSVGELLRSQSYQGPGYVIPTGLGEYNISVWAMQPEATFLDTSLVALIRLTCTASINGNYVAVQMNSGFGMSAPGGTWVHFSADVNTKTHPAVTADCFPDASGEVRSAVLYISQTSDPGSPNGYPDLYVDDLVIQSTDGHNLIGNPNFEAGRIDGWGTTGGGSALSVTDRLAHGGQNSLWQAGRELTTSAITYALPIGAARYAVSLWVTHDGTTAHQLALLPLYSCIGSPAVHLAAPSAAVTTSPGAWTELTGTFVFPPADAPPGCVLSQASLALGQAETGTCGDTVECPDLFVDDASITLK